jgi:hypothetical protein
MNFPLFSRKLVRKGRVALISYKNGVVMVPIARIIGLSLLTAGLGAGLAAGVFEHKSDYGLLCFVLACVGGTVGAIAGAAGEIVIALRQRSTPDD